MSMTEIGATNSWQEHDFLKELAGVIATCRASSAGDLARWASRLLSTPNGEAVFGCLAEHKILTHDDMAMMLPHLSQNHAVIVAVFALNNGYSHPEFYRLSIAALVADSLFQDAGDLLQIALGECHFSPDLVLPPLDLMAATKLATAILAGCRVPSVRLAVSLADAMRCLGCFPMARALLVEILVRGDRSQEVWQRLRDIHALEAGAVERNIADLQEILAGDPENAVVVQALSSELIGLGLYRQAIELLEDALKICKNSSYLWFSLGFSLTFRRFDVSDAMRAAAAFEQALALGADKDAVWSNLALLYCDIGDHQKARDALRHLPASCLIGWWPRSSPWPDPRIPDPCIASAPEPTRD